MATKQTGGEWVQMEHSSLCSEREPDSAVLSNTRSLSIHLRGLPYDNCHDKTSHAKICDPKYNEVI